MSNLSILQRNVIHSLDCEISAKSFLRACDKVSVLAAENFAYEVRMLVRSLQAPLDEAASLHGLNEVPTGLLKFILDRHWHWRFPARTSA